MGGHEQMADVRDGIPSDMYQKWERASDKSILVKTRAEGPEKAGQSCCGQTTWF